MFSWHYSVHKSIVKLKNCTVMVWNLLVEKPDLKISRVIVLGSRQTSLPETSNFQVTSHHWIAICFFEITSQWLWIPIGVILLGYMFYLTFSIVYFDRCNPVEVARDVDTSVDSWWLLLCDCVSMVYVGVYCSHTWYSNGVIGSCRHCAIGRCVVLWRD